MSEGISVPARRANESTLWSRSSNERNAAGAGIHRSECGRIYAALYKPFLLSGLILAALAGFSLTLFLPDETAEENASQKKTQNSTSPPERIVSLAPSITEFLFALDAGGRMAGVTRYCSFPPQAADLPVVGGFLDPNYEAILQASPDLVILLEASRDARRHLGRLGIDTLVVDHSNLDGIIDSAKTIAQSAGLPERGIALARSLDSTLGKIRQQTSGLHRPAVLLTIERPVKPGSRDPIRNVCIAGQDGFYSTMIRAAGGKNAFQKRVPKFPIISAEGILYMNPDIIIELRTNFATDAVDDERIIQQWSGLSRVNAVKNNAIHILRKDFLTIPGPRFIHTIERFKSLLHPELTAGNKKT